MVIERVEEEFFKYSARYQDSETPLVKFRNLHLASLFVRYLRGCKLSERDEYILIEAIKTYDKSLRADSSH